MPRLSVSGTDLGPARAQPAGSAAVHLHLTLSRGRRPALRNAPPRRRRCTSAASGSRCRPRRRDGRRRLPARDVGSDERESTKIIVDHLIAHDAELIFVPTKKDRPPLTFRIHDLEVSEVGFDRAMPFYAMVTNPVPTGLVETRGSIGPWNKDDPTGLPVSGDYTFTDADLSTINGIGGRLSSVGRYEGTAHRDFGERHDRDA